MSQNLHVHYFSLFIKKKLKIFVSDILIKQRAELMSRQLDVQQYKEFCEARQASFGKLHIFHNS